MTTLREFFLMEVAKHGYPQDIKTYGDTVDKQMQKFYGYSTKGKSAAAGNKWKDKVDKHFGFPGACDKFIKESFKNFRLVDKCISDMEAMWEMADQGGPPDPSYRYLFIDKNKQTFNSPAHDLLFDQYGDDEEPPDAAHEFGSDPADGGVAERTRLPKSDADWDKVNFPKWHVMPGQNKSGAAKAPLDDFEEL